MAHVDEGYCVRLCWLRRTLRDTSGRPSKRRDHFIHAFIEFTFDLKIPEAQDNPAL